MARRLGGREARSHYKEGVPSLNLPTSELKSKEEGGFKGGPPPPSSPFLPAGCSGELGSVDE